MQVLSSNICSSNLVLGSSSKVAAMVFLGAVFWPNMAAPCHERCYDKYQAEYHGRRYGKIKVKPGKEIQHACLQVYRIHYAYVQQLYR